MLCSLTLTNDYVISGLNKVPAYLSIYFFTAACCISCMTFCVSERRCQRRIKKSLSSLIRLNISSGNHWDAVPCSLILPEHNVEEIDVTNYMIWLMKISRRLLFAIGIFWRPSACVRRQPDVALWAYYPRNIDLWTIPLTDANNCIQALV